MKKNLEEVGVRFLINQAEPFTDPPLLNAVGVHEPFALRAIVEVELAGGVVGVGEGPGDADYIAALRRAGEAVVGLPVHATSVMWQAVAATLGGGVRRDAHGLTGIASAVGTVDRVVAPIEVACLDAQGRLAGVPVHALLGGAVRDRVPFSAYLFYKWGAHPGQPPDAWGAALDPDAIVAQAQAMVATYGFSAIKLKGGVLPPEEDIAAVEALHAALPGHPLRLDPNAAWTVDTAIEVGRRLDGVLEYLEDPTPGQAGMAEVARAVPMPLATNMCIVSVDQLAPGIEQRSVGVILSDHHYWGGLRRSQLLAGVCDAFGLGLSMHSNSHLGVSLAAMTHLAAATPNLTYACDTHWPWKDSAEDVVAPGAIGIENGGVLVPDGPGLGVDLDRDALARLHDQYLACGVTRRDDTGYRRRVEPDYELRIPRW